MWKYHSWIQVISGEIKKFTNLTVHVTLQDLPILVVTSSRAWRWTEVIILSSGITRKWPKLATLNVFYRIAAKI